MARAGGPGRLALVGAHGRMGTAIKLSLADGAPTGLALRAEIDRRNAARLASLAKNVDVVLDVSAPSATEAFLRTLLRRGLRIPYVIGCTGWSEKKLRTVHTYAERACVVLAPNFSPAVNVLLELVEQAARPLAAWGYTAVLHEIHHARKVDAPSGTAKAISSRLGSMRQQIHASRAGSIVGTHEVRFVGPSDVVTLTHEALDRSIFANGALLAAKWACGVPGPGLYSMKDVIFSKYFGNP